MLTLLSAIGVNVFHTADRCPLQITRPSPKRFLPFDRSLLQALCASECASDRKGIHLIDSESTSILAPKLHQKTRLSAKNNKPDLDARGRAPRPDLVPADKKAIYTGRDGSVL